MSWQQPFIKFWRVLAALLLLAAYLGPWASASDGMPPPEWCQAPHILENDRCIRLMPGFEIITFAGQAFIGLAAGIMSGAISFIGLAREVLFSLSISLLVLPAFMIMFPTPFRKNRHLLGLAILAWGLAAGVGLFIALSEPSSTTTRYWGVWLYIFLAIAGMLLEIKHLLVVQRTG
jgi:hypothetical protein